MRSKMPVYDALNDEFSLYTLRFEQELQKLCVIDEYLRKKVLVEFLDGPGTNLVLEMNG